jgi:charged multivesicular body protein 2A
LANFGGLFCLQLAAMSFLLDLFRRKTPVEQMKEYKRGLDKTVRDLEKERNKLLQQEKKLMNDMRKMAKQDQMDSVRIMAKDLVRTRKYASKFYRMKTQVQAVSLRLQTMSSTAQMSTAMAGVTRAMQSMNAQMNIPAMQNVMREFERQNEMMGMKEEMMGDAIDEVMDDDGVEEEETEMEIAKVMDEVGLDFKAKVGVTDSAMPATAQASKDEEADDQALEARLAALKTAMR